MKAPIRQEVGHALLTLVAGLVGGYSSHIRIETMPPEDLEKLRREHQRRYEYLQEPPMTAAMRGFIVYLCIVAGLYVAMDDPFKDPTPSQYIRLAGTLSLLAFMVGYDSSRLETIGSRWFHGPGRGLCGAPRANATISTIMGTPRNGARRGEKRRRARRAAVLGRLFHDKGAAGENA